MPTSSAPRGHRPNPDLQQRWLQRLQRFHRSGLTVAAFCQQEGVSVPSFYAWKRRLRTPSPDRPATTPRFVPVRLGSPTASAPVELLLPSGCVLRLSAVCDRTWLRDLLDLLGVTPC